MPPAVPLDSVATAYKSLPIALLWTANCTVLKSAWRLTTLDPCAGIVALSHVRLARQSRSNPVYGAVEGGGIRGRAWEIADYHEIN